MTPANQEVIKLLIEAGIAAGVVARYKCELDENTDDLERIGCYWAQRIAALNVSIREHADLCIILRDSTSRLLWLDIFRNRVIPVIRTHNILGEPTYG